MRGARAAELTAQLWAVSPEAAPPPLPRPPRQWQPHDRAHQRIIAARDISADTLPSRGWGGGAIGWHCSGPRGLAGSGITPATSPPALLPQPGSLRPPRDAVSPLQDSLIGRAPPSRPGIPRPSEGSVP